MIKVEGDGQCQPESFQAGAVLVKGKRVRDQGWRYWPGCSPRYGWDWATWEA